MNTESRHRSEHPQTWPVIAGYGAVVIGTIAYSFFNHGQKPQSETSVTRTAVDQITVSALVTKPPKEAHRTSSAD
jgi:hypothetical protein